MPPSECRLIVDPPAPGAWNMAVDEVLLDWTARAGRCCLRFYQWDPPTLSLGYFQLPADRSVHGASAECELVRRASGGGAILHDRELTYAFTAPAAHPLARRRRYLYETIHHTLIEVLADLGVEAACSAGSREPAARQPFLCFQRRSVGDLLVGDTKIAGSAQRRVRGAVLQHGSVLLRRSACAPELGSLEEAAGLVLTAEELIERWLPKLGASLHLSFRRDPLDRPQRQQAAAVAEAKYAAAAWTEKRAR